MAVRDRAREALLMGLRLAEGIEAATFLRRTGVVLGDALEPEILAASMEEGYLMWDGVRLVASDAGRRRLDALLPRLAV